MKSFYFSGDIHRVFDGLVLLQKKLDFTIEKGGFPVILVYNEKKLQLIKKKENAFLYFSEPSHLFRLLTVLINSPDETIYLEENPQFKRIGPMIDTSRNAVMSVEKIKETLLTCSTLGFNQLLLYMEDTYDIPEYPYFGYLRGAYTYEELKEIDAFGFSLGIEVIPAIQVLAHLKNPLKWNFTREFRDTEDILLVNEPKTYLFLEKAIKAVSRPFRTKRIHIGMDEAHQLGLGRFLQLHGIKNRFELMNEHLSKVLAICETEGLTVEMWSDMFFRLGSKTGDYYDSDFTLSEEVINKIPTVSMVYWDYYHAKENEYLDLIKHHKKLKKELIFAGGIWTWNGIAPNYGKTVETTKSALMACKKEDVTCVYATLWGDDGAETPFDASLLGLQLFAEHQFYKTVSNSHLKKQFKLYQKEEMDSFMLLDLFDQTPGVSKNNPHGSNTSKFCFYQDILLGLYDETIRPFELVSHYENLSVHLSQCSYSSKLTDLFEFYQLFALVLSKKCQIGIDLRLDYQQQRNDLIPDYMTKIEEIKQLVIQLKEKHRLIWFKANKPFGFEILDIRYGGVLARLDSTLKRLQDWQNGNKIPELECSLLPFDGPYRMPEGCVGRNLYHGIISPSKLSDV